jgi:hypothetical protein
VTTTPKITADQQAAWYTDALTGCGVTRPTRLTPLVNAAVRINTTNLADGVEVRASVDDLTVITAGVRRPNRPARVVLTPAAKAALRSGRALMGTDVAAELASLNMIDADGRLTENGTRMADYLGWQFILGQLAKQVRAEGITGEDLADLAAGIDAGEDTGSIPGTSVDFQLAFALAASLSDQSAEDLRQDLETYLGWND